MKRPHPISLNSMREVSDQYNTHSEVQFNDYHYVIYTDASFTPEQRHCGWAFVILVNGHLLLEGAGKLASTSIHEAEHHAMLQGLLARPNNLPTLVLCDIITGKQRFPAGVQDNLTIRRLTAKHNDRWHVYCHNVSKAHGRDPSPPFDELYWIREVEAGTAARPSFGDSNADVV
jgi:hypothetical protein